MALDLQETVCWCRTCGCRFGDWEKPVGYPGEPLPGCPDCAGTGLLEANATCDGCYGTGVQATRGRAI